MTMPARILLAQPETNRALERPRPSFCPYSPDCRELVFLEAGKTTGSSPTERANKTSILQGFVFYFLPCHRGYAAPFGRVCHLRSSLGCSNGLQGVLRKPFITAFAFSLGGNTG